MTLGLLFFLLFLYFLIANSKSKNPEKLFVIIATIPMILLSGLRHEEVGNDTAITMIRFEGAINTSWSEVFSNFWERYSNPNVSIGKDPAEMVFYKLLSMITEDSRVFLFVVATIVLVSFAYFVYRSSLSLRTILFSYIFYVSITYGYIPNSSFRQSIAFAVLLFAFIFLNRKKYISFLLLLFLASFFHNSVLTACVILPLMFVKISKVLYWFCLLPFLYVFFNYRAFGFLLGDLNEIYGGYFGSDYYTYHNQPIMVVLMILGLYVYIGVTLRSRMTIENDKLYICGAAFTLIFVPFVRLDPSALRLISYFSVLMGIQVGNSYLRTSSLRSLFWVIVAIFLTKAALTPDDGYRFMWQEKEPRERYGFVIKQSEKEINNDIGFVLQSRNEARCCTFTPRVISMGIDAGFSWLPTRHYLQSPCPRCYLA